jgi:hypothetical protein
MLAVHSCIKDESKLKTIAWTLVVVAYSIASRFSEQLNLIITLM